MNNLIQDVRYALRAMRKSPGFAAVAILTLALGIGANTAIFTVVNAVFFHPIPVEKPETLVDVFTTADLVAGVNFFPVSFPNGQDIQQRVQSFAGAALSTGTSVSMTVNGAPDTFFAQLVSGNYFDVLGVKPVLGRTFRPEEDAEPGAGPVIVLSYGLWQRRFGADKKVIGQSVLLNGQGFTIIGVAPSGFQGTTALGGPDMWIPMSMHEPIVTGLTKVFFNERRFLGFNFVARMKPGARVEQARAELKTIALDLERDFPLANKGRGFSVFPLLESVLNPNQRGQLQFVGAIMMGVVGIVLLIACFNVANLLLARASGRKREMSIRAAVGASRGRIMAQLLTEALVLATAGGLLGLGLAALGRNLLWKFRPPQFPVDGLDLSLDTHVLLFTFLVAIGTGLIFGLAPALQASRPDLVSELKERSGGEPGAGSVFKLRDLLVVVQVAVCMVALIGAGLFLLSLRNAQDINPGFDTHHLAMLSFDPGSLGYDAEHAKQFQQRVLEVVQNVPGVQQATMANIVPLFNGGFGRTTFIEGVDPKQAQNGKFAQIGVVAQDFLPSMGIPLVKGRGFDSSDRENSPLVAIINETAAKTFWPGEDPIGKRFIYFHDTVYRQVVGVARDSKYNALGEFPQPYMYLPLVQNPSTGVTVFFRTKGEPGAVLNTVRTQVQALDRNLPLTNVWPIGEVIDQALWAARFGASLLGVFAAIAMVLCAVGIYGVVGYSVRQRVREFGIRMALGAQQKDVLMMVVRQSSLPMVMGLVLGAAGAMALALWAAALLKGLLYGVSVTSPVAYGVTALLLACVGLAACLVPARRAAKVDPMVALHYE
jgi:putative ABC transport system permease protein